MIQNRTIPLMGTDVEHFKADHVPLEVYADAVMRIGTKRRPTITPNGQYHVDNAFAELATNTARSAGELMAGYSLMRDRLEIAMGMPLKGVDAVTLNVNKAEMPRFYRSCSTFGCSPDMQNGVYRDVPYEIKRQPLRECGLHLHFQLPSSVTDQYTTDYSRDIDDGELIDPSGRSLMFVNLIENALSDFHVYLDEGDMWFRQSGCYRLKPYGVEYRSLGASVVEDPTRWANVCNVSFSLLTEYWRQAA